MSTKMLTSTSEVTNSYYIDYRSSECLDATNVNKNVDMSTFLLNSIHKNTLDERGVYIVFAKQI